VIVIEAWPIRAWIAFGWAPDAMDRATLVWRSSWNRHDRPASRGGPAEVVGPEARRRQRVAGGVREHEAVRAGLCEPLDVVS
jgi:hypothetical protein